MGDWSMTFLFSSLHKALADVRPQDKLNTSSPLDEPVVEQFEPTQTSLSLNAQKSGGQPSVPGLL